MIDKNLLNGKHFCILPWVHARINQDGNVYPCCRIDSFYSYGSLKENSFTDIWNDAPIREMRSTLKNDNKFSSCRDCYHIDAIGGNSMRKLANAEFKDHIHRVAQTENDGRILTNALLFLDIRFSNVCNLKCRSCNPTNSTGWYQDAKYFSGDILSSVIRPTRSLQDLWTLLDAQIPSLTQIYFAGGEPLLQDEHYLLLEKLVKLAKTDVLLQYNTNLTTLEYKEWSVLKLWASFPRLSIIASIDGVKEQVELLRKGVKWDLIVKNLSMIKKSLPHVNLCIAPTVGVTNVFHITEAIQTFIDLQIVSLPDHIEINILNDPKYLSVHILNLTERLSLKKHFADFLFKLEPDISPLLFQKISSLLNNILAHLDTEPMNDKERLKFKKFTHRLDIIRKEKTVLLFPELVDLLY